MITPRKNGKPNISRLYAADRDAAYIAFVEDGDFAHLDQLTEMWGGLPIPHTDEWAKVIYLAAQECPAIPHEVKAKALSAFMKACGAKVVVK